MIMKREHHRIGAVSRKPGMNNINCKMKTDYRYFDPSITFNNWNIDNIEAKENSTFQMDTFKHKINSQRQSHGCLFCIVPCGTFDITERFEIS